MGAPPSPATIARFSEKEREQIVREYLDGGKEEEIGKRHVASSRTIRYLLQTLNVPMRKRGQAKSADISGQRFGRLTAIKPTGRRIHGSNIEWEFSCECGNPEPFFSSVHSVRSGNTSSCGCLKLDRITETQRVDLRGLRVGRLTAVEFSHSRKKRNGNNGSAYWVWLCECGEKVVAAGAGVKRRFKINGDVACTVCAAKTRAKEREIDLTGQRFGMLVGLERLDFDKSPAQGRWLWQCDCGETCIRYYSNVCAHENANCGCSNKTTAADRTGERFGCLVAIRSLGKKTGESTYTWLFQCDCGNPCEARLRDAVSGLQKSCGCRQGGYDTVQAWLDGQFRNAEEKHYFYVFPLRHHSGFSKPGIAEKPEVRKKGSRGEYGDLYDFIEATRLDAWLLEQAVLKATFHSADCPLVLSVSKWEGHTEVRRMEPSAVFDIAVTLHSELMKLGREEFAIRFLTLTPQEHHELQYRLQNVQSSQAF